MRIISRVMTLLLAAGFGAAAFLMSTNAVMAASASEAEVTINAANGADGNGQVEQAVGERVRALCARFPIYQG